MDATREGKIKSLGEYFLLGASGLRVSPLCLGTMTFGTEWGWGSDENTARLIFSRYLEAGGNFIDTADGYTNGHSEELVGNFIKETRSRDRVVLATKFTFNAEPGNPNAGGNGRKNMLRAIEHSLRRLQTDYVDLYWLHVWDGLTPVEEVMETADALVRAGKIRYFGLSDTPAWYLARAQTLAQARGQARITALQLEYSLVERNIEREHIPAARELGMGLCPWSPLAAGFLSGKYQPGKKGGAEGEGRLKILAGRNQNLNKFTERNWNILAELVKIARELGKTPAQTALNWVASQPGVVSTIIGATNLSQLEDNLNALEFELPSAMKEQLEQISRPEAVFPYAFFANRERINGGIVIKSKPRAGF